MKPPCYTSLNTNKYENYINCFSVYLSWGFANGFERMPVCSWQQKNQGYKKAIQWFYN
jgi:hypothetical protein